MKNSFIGIFFLFLLILISCEKDKVDELSHISSNRYYDTDILDTIPIYGKWEVINTSGGIHGGGYKQDFDFLLFKRNGIFGVLRNDSLLTVGKVVVKSSISRFPIFQFIADEEELGLTMLADQFVSFNSDTLNLSGLGDDNFNTHFVKVP